MRDRRAAANELPPPEWNYEAKKNYQLAIGAAGDGRFVQGWHGREVHMRWSQAESLLKLPVIPNEPYTVTLKIDAPKPALSPEAGLYLEGKRIAQFAAGAQSVTAELPALTASRVVLMVKCTPWVPAQVHKGSHDDRTLGIHLSEISMRAKSAGPRVFDANKGEWK